MRLKIIFAIVLTGSFLFLNACSAWKSKNNPSAVVDGNAQVSSNAEPKGLGEDEDLQTDVATNQNDADNKIYYFDFDKSTVRDADKPAIEANAEYFVGHPNAKTLIEGHTDPRGSREYNIALGERRSKAIAEIMKEQGVKSTQIRLISYGSEKLASQGHSESDYQQDRRGKLVYLEQS